MANYELLGLKPGEATTELHFSSSAWVDVYSECHLAKVEYSDSALTLRLIKFYDVGPIENGTEVSISFTGTQLDKLQFTGGLEDLSNISEILLEKQDEETGDFSLHIKIGELGISLRSKSVEVTRQAADKNELHEIIRKYIEVTGEKDFPGSKLLLDITK